MTIEQVLVGVPIPDIELRSKPTEKGPHWYRRLNGEYEMVQVSADLQYVSKFNGDVMTVDALRGKFYGPIKPTKYGA